MGEGGGGGRCTVSLWDTRYPRHNLHTRAEYTRILCTGDAIKWGSQISCDTGVLPFAGFPASVLYVGIATTPTEGKVMLLLSIVHYQVLLCFRHI